MKTIQFKITDNKIQQNAINELRDWKPDLVLAFGHVGFFEKGGIAPLIQKEVGGKVVGCSTAGEISDKGTHDQSLVLTGVKFDQVKIKIEMSSSHNVDDSTDCGEKLGGKLNGTDLKALFVLGKGLNINGSALIAGLKKKVPQSTVITGGLAGDGGAFKCTYVLHDSIVDTNAVAAIGFYGEAFEVGFGSRGGWEPFGPVRKITKASGTNLLELDGEKALNVYKTYLKGFAKDLPASGLLFPLALLDTDQSSVGLIRTILGINENEGSLQLAGDIHEGQLVRLMHTKNQGLVQGAQNAAKLAGAGKEEDGLTILVSCVGRKLVLGEDVDEEIEAVQDVLHSSSLTGFYSYGEICPFRSPDDCQLHNQTMTVTYITEKKAA